MCVSFLKKYPKRQLLVHISAQSLALCIISRDKQPHPFSQAPMEAKRQDDLCYAALEGPSATGPPPSTRGSNLAGHGTGTDSGWWHSGPYSSACWVFRLAFDGRNAWMISVGNEEKKKNMHLDM